ncbi:hypothetical protein D3C85_1802390 [compost metagenome]
MPRRQLIGLDPFQHRSPLPIVRQRKMLNASHFEQIVQCGLSFQIQFHMPGSSTGCELSRNVRAIAARCSAAVSS